ncbi:MAG: hypothetical protein ACJ8CR_37230 [Roseiflexaceae bacterium]
MAAGSLLTIALGVWAGGLVQASGLLVLFVIMLSWEHAAAKLVSRDVAQEPHDEVFAKFGVRLVAPLGGRLNQHWLVAARRERLVLRR